MLVKLLRSIASVVCHIHYPPSFVLEMNIIRFFSFLTIFGLIFFSTTGKIKINSCIKINHFSFVVVYGKDKVDDDVEIGEEEETVLRSDETVTPASDILVR